MNERPDPQLIQRLFDEDPLNLSEGDLDLIIAEFRAERMDYMQPNEPKKTKGSKAVSKAPPAISLDGQMDLGDLGL